MADPKPPAEATRDEPRTIAFEYIKSASFRMIHADGVFGGISPRGQMFLTLFSERPPIPQRAVYQIEREKDTVKLGAELPAERVTRDGIVREAEVGVLMTPDTARALRDWLTERLEIFDGKAK